MKAVLKLALVFSLAVGAMAADPLGGHLNTRWAAEVSTENPWPEYPRPQMVREDWLNLNGQWDYAIATRDALRPERWEGRILVPFCVESALSGVQRTVTPEHRLWYRRSFRVPADWGEQRVLLHFGAVDWQAEVLVNGRRAGEHRGGYTPFSFDITNLLKPDGDQELVVAVWDPTDTGTQARGKQVLEPRGIWYTAVTGIWQTVWLEPVPEVSITRLEVEPNIDNEALLLRVETSAEAEVEVRAAAVDGGQLIAEAAGRPGEQLTLSVSNPRLWSPDTPYLYDLQVELRRGGAIVDEVSSYFGMRKIALGKDQHGHNLLFLNNEPLFQLGPLDQGWWPDGLYTAPTDGALRYDIEITKKLGFNMARKHVKVEPARWYFHCDRLGLLVWQDMPSAFLSAGEKRLFVRPEDSEDAPREGVSEAQFEEELREMIDAFRQFPSIVVWVPFNEGWGQYDTARIARWVEQYDPSRLVNATSGWTDRGVGDMYDAHIYPGPGLEQDVGADRATVLGEFGGLGWPVEGHLWWNKRNWGYRTLTSREALGEKYREVVGNSVGLRGFGMAAAVYTQTTDVEGEVNGLMTYDRAIVKFDPEMLQELHERLYATAPAARVLVAASKQKPQPWRYTFETPGEGWMRADSDDSSWRTGSAPFQTGDNSLFPTGAKWTAQSIWLRQEFTLEDVPGNLWLELLENVNQGSVYLNGEPVLEIENQRARHRHYTNYDLSQHAGLLRQGENVLAVHASRDEGSRAVDASLYILE